MQRMGQFDEMLPTGAFLPGHAVRKKHCRKLMAVKAARRFRSQCSVRECGTGRRTMNDVVGRYSRPAVQPPGHTGSEAGFVEETASASSAFVFMETRAAVA
jgi:hypothetical protein